MLEDLGIVGISWRHSDSKALQRFALRRGEEAELLAQFAKHAGLSELAYLETCNRIELIFSRTPDTPTKDIRPLVYKLLTRQTPAAGEAERSLKAWQGEGACEHLFLVAAGLDSAVVGEVEIVGQVRSCHELALDLGLSGYRLELLFKESLRIAAEVRDETNLGEGRVSLAEIAVKHIRERLEHTPGAVALVGISPMTERTALSLTKKSLDTKVSLIIVNRTADKARTFADKLGAEAMSLKEFVTEPPAIEAVLTSTSAETPLLTKSVLERIAAKSPSGQPPLFIDMAVPPDIDKRACKELHLKCLSMDDIIHEAESNRQARLMEAAQARQRVDNALLRLHDQFAERAYGPLFGTLQNRYRHTARMGVNRLLSKELKGLGAAEREAIETWAEVLARRFAHIPTLGLRGLLHYGPDGSLEAFLEGLDTEFADELRQALNRSTTKSGQNRVAES